MSTPSGSASCRTATSLRSRLLPHHAGAVGASPGVLLPRHRGGHKGILQRFHTSGSGSAWLFDKQWFALVLAQVRVQFGSVILRYASQTSSTVTGLLGALILDGFHWNMPMLSNIIDHLAQVLLLTCILNELTFVLACFVFCQNSSCLQ